MKINEIVASGFNSRPWLTGKCFDFALALHERMPDAEFVAIGESSMGADHVGLRRGDVYYDVRGPLDARTFLAHHLGDWTGDPGELIAPIDRGTVELHAGVAGFPPPYRGNRDIAAARKAVDAVYGKGRIAEALAPPRKHFVGTCQNSFDEDTGDCVIPGLPWSDVSAFAVADENAVSVHGADFQRVADVPINLGQSLRGHHLEYLRSDDGKVYMIYDHNTDLHYFFV